LLANALDQRWQSCRDQLKRCRQEKLAPDAVHDLRVAIRRLLALLDLLADLPPLPGSLRAVRKPLRRLLDALSRLRDSQVQCQLAAKLAAPDATTRRLFRRWLAGREAKRRPRARQRLLAFPAGQWAKPFRQAACGLRTAAAAEPARERCRRAVRQPLEEAWRDAEKRRQRLSPTDPHSLHRLRLALKEYRYALEALLPLLPPGGDHLLRQLRAAQTRLGGIQDLRVQAALLAKCAAQAPAAAAGRLSGLEKSVHRRLARRGRAFLAAAARAPIPAPSPGFADSLALAVRRWPNGCRNRNRA
jgi:CHAD domain-containing protein